MPIGQPGRVRSASRLLRQPIVLLTACIVIAGVGLAWFMVRTVIQERAAAAQEVRDAAATAASRVAGGIVSELERLDRSLRVPAAVPATEGLDTSDDSILLVVGRDGVQAFSPKLPIGEPEPARAGTGEIAQPPRRLLYEIEPANRVVDESAWPAALLAAEALEIRAGDNAGAIAAYRAVLQTAASNSPLRLVAQQRLARSLRKAGRATEALGVLQQIIDAHPLDDSPALAAAWYNRCAIIRAERAANNQSRIDYRQHAFRDNQSRIDYPRGTELDPDACAVAFYTGLVDGRWTIEKALYEFYADSARRWTQSLAGRTDVARLIAREAAQLTLTRAALVALQAWRAVPRRGSAGHLVLTDGAAPTIVAWRTSSQGEPALLVLGPRAATTRVFAPLVARHASTHSVSIVANRIVVFSRPAGETKPVEKARNPSADAATDAATSPAQDAAISTVEDGPIVWRVTARPDATRDPRRGLTTRTGVYLGTLALMLVSVALAGYFAIRTVRQELEVARLKSEFVSTVSHEFRSPLSAISHLAELLDRGRVVDEERKREYYRLILGESGRLRRLVENLLNFARIEEGRQQFQLEPTDVGRWLRPTVEEFQASQAAAGKQIVLEVAPDLPAVRADAEAMTTVLGNLLDNAVKYSPGSAAVWVQAMAAAGAVEIRVRDEGAGIAAADQAHIFERFYRARDAGAVAGTGLGLALVQRIVAAHGGTVNVESRAGKGSTFTVRLPPLIEEKA